jgi:hypothetical protein
MLAVMYIDRGKAIRIITARQATLRERRDYEKPSSKTKASGKTRADEILPQYDFGDATRNKYAARYAAGSTVVVLEPDVAAAFPTSRAANDALRGLASIMERHRRQHSALRRSS